MFTKVLVANRGEIAARIVRALRELDIPSVAVFSDADRAALHVRLADEAVHIGAAPSSESYLNIGKIIDAACSHGAEAIHPGYGFLSENAGFAQSCRDAGLVFIGPSPDAIRRMGLKTEARRVAASAGVPVVPGTEAPLENAREANRVAAGIGYPVMLKAAAGGGGKGMRVVRSAADLDAAFRDAVSEAERAFSSGAVYLEKLIERPRHVEIQVLGDHHGNIVHLGERECSIQRRHQKLIEESPSPLAARIPGLRNQMGEAAVRAARAAGYTNAGTVEFLADDTGHFYFLEMNTRLQVEHPVTELVTGRDLVHLQLRVAEGEPLGFDQQDVVWQGTAIECRICAEDPENRFLPSPGTILRIDRPSGPGVRLDSGVYPGWSVPMDYDPLLAKLVVWAETREQAIARMAAALREYSITGIKTNLGFFRRLLADPEFQAGRLHTGFVEEFLARAASASQPASPELETVAALVASTLHMTPKDAAQNGRPDTSRWLDGRSRALR